MPGNEFTTKIYDAFLAEDFSHMFLVLEFGDKDLFKLMKKSNFILEQKDIIKIIYKLICALNFIHAANLIHRDIKPSNILIDHDLNVKICDFGLSRSLP